jgi:hypothetical protein
MRVSFLLMMVCVVFACGCDTETDGFGVGGGAFSSDDSGVGDCPDAPDAPGGEPVARGDGGDEVFYDGATVVSSDSGEEVFLPADPDMPGNCPDAPGDDPAAPVAGEVTVLNIGSEAVAPPDGPIAVAVVNGTERPTSADDYRILGVGETGKFEVSGTFTVFVGDPADPASRTFGTYCGQARDGAATVSISSSSDLTGGRTTITTVVR